MHARGVRSVRAIDAHPARERERNAQQRVDGRPGELVIGQAVEQDAVDESAVGRADGFKRVARVDDVPQSLEPRVQDVTLQVIEKIVDEKGHLRPQGPHRHHVLCGRRALAQGAADGSPISPTLCLKPRLYVHAYIY